MLRYHMAVITNDKRLRREVRRVTSATNATADFLEKPSEFSAKKHVNLVIFDARKHQPPSKLLDSIPREAAISYILEGNNLFRQIDLLRDERVETLLCRDEIFDDDEFIASATKSLRHDIFGLHKYFPWGVTTFTMMVKSYDDKSQAIDIIMQYAQEAGMRGSVRERIQLACDELMMNALYHAPRDEEGKELYRHKPRKELARLSEVLPIQVQYGCSGRYFGLAVRDNCGSLTRSKIVDYLARIRDGGAEIEDKSSGAGLGLISVTQSVSKLIFNLQPGSASEVVALFDMDLIARGLIGAQSLHLFTITSDAEAEQLNEWRTVNGEILPAPDDKAEGKNDSATAAPPPSQSFQAARWALIAILLSITTAMALAYYFTRTRLGAEMIFADAAPSIAIVVDPADATVTLNGAMVMGSHPVPLPRTDSYELVVQKPGHKTWTKTLTSEEVNGNLRLYVNLDQVE